MLSFIVPAHNEQACLDRTLQAIHESARVVGRPYETIVVDDASTDATAEIARQHHARVVSVNHRQIAATRNAGARAATGEFLFFVDADTTLNPQALAAAVRALDEGAAGGGGPTWIERNEVVPLYIRLVVYLGVVGVKLAGFTGGAFMFCTRAAFQASGGFNERLYWSEEGGFALALKREGRFVVLWKPVLTSGRRFRKTSAWQLFAGGVRLIFSPRKTFTERSSVEKIWYDSNRADDDKMPDSWVVRISNAFALVVVVLMITGPVWDFIPWSLTPLASLMGKFRFAIGMFLCPLGMFGWPIAVVLLLNLVRQKRWTGLAHSAALIGFCLWQAWGSTLGVIRIGTILWHWVSRRLA